MSVLPCRCRCSPVDVGSPLSMSVLPCRCRCSPVDFGAPLSMSVLPCRCRFSAPHIPLSMSVLPCRCRFSPLSLTSRLEEPEAGSQTTVSAASSRSHPSGAPKLERASGQWSRLTCGTRHVMCFRSQLSDLWPHTARR